MGILLDSGFLYALKMDKDIYNKIAKQILQKLNWQKYGTIQTTDLIVAETLSLAQMRTRGNADILKKLEDLFWGDENFFQIISIEKEEYPNIQKIMVKYSVPSKGVLLSFFDASLVYLAKKRKITTIISFDNHFDGKLTRIFTV